MSNTDHCCKDGAPDDYPCRATYTCGKGTCLRATYKLCTDGPTGAGDYQCSSTETCGRGICVQATKTLCGTSGTKTCGATQTCCGTSAATKNSEGGMVCNTNMQPCPADRKSDTSYSSAPYKYGGDSSSDSSSEFEPSLLEPKAKSELQVQTELCEVFEISEVGFLSGTYWRLKGFNRPPE